MKLGFKKENLLNDKSIALLIVIWRENFRIF